MQLLLKYDCNVENYWFSYTDNDNNDEIKKLENQGKLIKSIYFDPHVYANNFFFKLIKVVYHKKLVLIFKFFFFLQMILKMLYK